MRLIGLAFSALLLSPVIGLSQCQEKFSVGSVQTTVAEKGVIELEIEHGNDLSTYKVRVFEIKGHVIERMNGSFQEENGKIIIKGLEPAIYWIRVDWREECYQTLGGLFGITVESTQ